MTTYGVLAQEGKLFSYWPPALAALGDTGIIDPPWRQVRMSRDAPEQIRKLPANGVDRLLVWGADGTVRRCIDSIVEQGQQALPDDDRLDVGVITAERRLDWLRVSARAAVGRMIRIRLESKRSRELDGGGRPRTKQFDVSVLPSRLPVYVPGP